MAYPSISKKAIKDKNKIDGLLRIITLGQIFWFIINTVARAVQGLEVTLGELTTAAFIVFSVGTVACWIHKQADAVTPEPIFANVTLAEILVNAGNEARQTYYRTPLDFVSRKEWHWSLYWSNWINILRNMGISFEPPRRPVDRFENTVALPVEGWANCIFLAMTAVYL